MPRLLVVLVVPVAALAGCATSLSSFQPAHVPPRGHISAEAGFDVSIPTGTISRSIDAAETLAEAAENRALSEDEQIQVIGAGVNLVLNPPFFVQHIGLAFTPVERFELGLRYAAKAWRLGARYQFFRQDTDGFDLTAGLGAQRFSFKFPVEEVIEIVQLDDFVRWNFDVPIVFGRHGDFYRLWGGPRLVVSRFSTALTVRNAPGMSAMTLASADGTGLYVGAQGGAAIGFRKLFIGFELTVVRLLGEAQLQVFGREVTSDMDSWVIYPGLALMGEF